MRYRNIHDAPVTDHQTFEVAPGEEFDHDGIVSPWLVPVEPTGELAEYVEAVKQEAASEAGVEPLKKTAAKKAATKPSEAPEASADAEPKE